MKEYREGGAAAPKQAMAAKLCAHAAGYDDDEEEDEGDSN